MLGFGLDTSSSNQNGVTPEQLESIKELINVDHLYSKRNSSPKCNNKLTNYERPSFKIQLSGSVPSTKLIKQPKDEITTIKQENKPIALFKDSALKSRTVHSKSGVFTTQKNGVHHNLVSNVDPRPMLSDEHMDAESHITCPDMYLKDIDAELDSILNDRCDSHSLPLVAPFDLDFSSSSESECGSVLSQPSASSPLDTPIVTDMLNPFDSGFNNDEALFSNSFSAELFPQLSAVI